MKNDLFSNAEIGDKKEILGKSVECIHIEKEIRNMSPPGCYPHYAYVNSKVIYAYVNSDGDLKTIEFKG
jgi:hypothetical protein